MLLPDNLRQEICRIATEYSNVEQVVLFGSRARGDADERSDIDLAIKAPKIVREQWLKLCDALENMPTLLIIQVVRLDNASIKLQQNVANEGVIIYAAGSAKSTTIS